MRNWQTFLTESYPVLLDRYVSISQDLAGTIEEIALIQSDEVRQKAAALATIAQETATASLRDQHVRMTVVEPPASRIVLEGHRDALIVEREVLAKMLEGK